MIANPPPVTIAINGREVGMIGSRWCGLNPRRLSTKTRMRKAKQAGALLFARLQAGARRNPSHRRSSEVEIYSDIERVYGKKGRQSVAAGEHFVHNFRHAAAFGRPDGTVVLRGRGGRRLWDYFRT